jgi:thioredoxin-like negative regulator of GroEL
MGREKDAAATEARFRAISAMHVKMQTLQARVGHNPDDSKLRLELARLYQDMGLVDKAGEQYEVAVRLTPGDEHVTREVEAFVAKAAESRGKAGNSDFIVSVPQ